MVKYILKRLLYLVFVFFIVSIIMFGIYKCVPGDPARMMIDSSKQTVDPERYEQMYQDARERLGLDKPVVVQYVSWLGNMLTGDFGFSSQYRRPVAEIVADPIGNTVMLNVASMILVFVITIPLGIITAVKKGSVLDNVVQVGTVIGYSLPSFVIALIFIFLFTKLLPIFPISGVNSAGISGSGFTIFMDKLYHMALPCIVMTFASLGSITRYVRAAMIDVLRQDYIRTARAKGLREKVVIYSHAFRNALIPVVTTVLLQIPHIIGGSTITEQIFGWPGIGSQMISSINNRDYPMVMGIAVILALTVLATNILLDIVYGLVDPRISYE